MSDTNRASFEVWWLKDQAESWSRSHDGDTNPSPAWGSAFKRKMWQAWQGALAQPIEGSIDSQLDSNTLKKMAFLSESKKSLRPVGVVLIDDDTGQRATIDMGRVTWTGQNAERGAMRQRRIAEAARDDVAMPDKLRVLSKHMEDVAVEMDYFGGFAPWAKHGGELMGAAMMVAEWAASCDTSTKEAQ